MVETRSRRRRGGALMRTAPVLRLTAASAPNRPIGAQLRVAIGVPERTPASRRPQAVPDRRLRATPMTATTFTDDSSDTLAVVALVVGGVGLLAGIAAVVVARRDPSRA